MNSIKVRDSISYEQVATSSEEDVIPLEDMSPEAEKVKEIFSNRIESLEKDIKAFDKINEAHSRNLKEIKDSGFRTNVCVGITSVASVSFGAATIWNVVNSSDFFAALTGGFSLFSLGSACLLKCVSSTTELQKKYDEEFVQNLLNEGLPESKEEIINMTNMASNLEAAWQEVMEPEENSWMTVLPEEIRLDILNEVVGKNEVTGKQAQN